jgi:hypothetical protein
MSHDHPVWALLDRLQMDNRDQAAKLTELRAQIAALGVLPAVSRRENAAAYHPFNDEAATELYSPAELAPSS